MRTQSSTKYSSCPTCGSQFPAPAERQKFNPICASCGSELRLRCDYCGVFYTPKRWVFTTENRKGNQFCSPAHKKRSRIEEISREKERVRAELFKPRQCARNGAPTARDAKYRVDCPVVFTPVRLKDIFCSVECKDMARYYSDPEKKRTYANKRYAENPVLFTQRARTYRKRKIKRLGVKAVRALESARYPIKKARKEQRRAQELEKLAKAARVLKGRPEAEETAARITVAAYLSLLGTTKYDMKEKLFPAQNDADLAYKNTKNLFRKDRHLADIESEEQRLSVLSASDQLKQFERASARLAVQSEMFSTAH